MQTELNSAGTEEKMKVSRRDWVKNFAIVFLAVLLVLTLFSNTIRNYSLPEVAVQNPVNGTIISKIRGQGTVKSNQTYNVTIDETREIKAVHVKAGQTVEAGQVIFTLADKESQELQTAQEDLYTMQLNYQKALVTLDPSYASENHEISKARQVLQDALDDQERAAEYKTAYDEFKQALRAAQDEADRVSDEAEAAARSEKKALEDAEAAQSDAERAQEKAQDALDLREEQLGVTYAEAKAAVEAAETSLETLNTELENLKKQLTNLKSDLSSMYSSGITYESVQSDLQIALNKHSDATNERAQIVAAGGTVSAELENEIAALEAEIEYLQYRLSNVSSVSGDTSTLQSSIKEKQREIDAKEKEIAKAEEKLTELKLTASDRTLINAKVNLDSAKKQVSAAKDQVYSSQSAYDKKVASFDDAKKKAEKAADNAQKALDQFTEDNEGAPSSPEDARDAVVAAQNSLEALYITLNESVRQDGQDAGLAALDLEDMKRKIEEKQADIDEMRAETVDAEVKTRYGGTVSTLNVTAGDQAGAGSELAVIEVTDKGYTLSFTVTNEQAKKVRAGDRAELQNYYGSEITATLASIKNAADSGGRSKELTFELIGELTVGEQLTLTVGQRGQNYDTIVPNSAIREDSNGKFVLVMETKSSPLGNRFIAKRMDVEVIESDDTNSAVSGGLSYYDYVITTATAPIESGQMVRQENS